jgi:beta-galactosidase
VYTNCEEVEIRVNDRLIARRVVQAAAVRLKEGIAFETGKLEVIGFIAGIPVARHTQYSAGAPAEVVLSTDRSTLARDGRDVAIVRGAIVDAQGRFVPTAETSLTFHVVGDAQVIGVGNGDPSSVAPQKSHSRETFNGYAAAIVQAGHSTGPIVVEASGIGVSGARLTFGSTDAPESGCVHRPIDERENPLDPHEILAPEGMSGDGVEQQNLSWSSAVAPAIPPA